MGESGGDEEVRARVRVRVRVRGDGEGRESDLLDDWDPNLRPHRHPTLKVSESDLFDDEDGGSEAGDGDSEMGDSTLDDDLQSDMQSEAGDIGEI